ncbi:MAG: transporter [Anaeromyxobacteraceae bacterium]
MVIGAILLPLPALAAHPLVTDDTGTQGARRTQLELTTAVGEDRPVPGDSRTVDRSAEAAAAVSYGLGDALDLVIGLPFGWSRSLSGGEVVGETSGTADAALELKWRFLEHGGFSAAAKPGLSLPTGSARRGLGAGRVGYGLALVVSQALGPVTLHVNGGWSHAEHALPEVHAVSRSDAWSASAAAAVSVAPGLMLVANVGMESPGERGATTWPAFALAGAIYSLSDRLDLDVGVRAALNAADTDLLALAGAAYRY